MIQLSPRQQQVAKLVCTGMTNRQIAQRHGVKLSTVKKQMETIMNKLGAVNRTQVAAIITKQAR